MPSRTLLMDARAIGRCLQRMASEIVEQARGTDQLVLVGIQRRGVELAARLTPVTTAMTSAPAPPIPVTRASAAWWRQ